MTTNRDIAQRLILDWGPLPTRPEHLDALTKALDEARESGVVVITVDGGNVQDVDGDFETYVLVDYDNIGEGDRLDADELALLPADIRKQYEDELVRLEAKK